MNSVHPLALRLLHEAGAEGRTVEEALRDQLPDVPDVEVTVKDGCIYAGQVAYYSDGTAETKTAYFLNLDAFRRFTGECVAVLRAADRMAAREDQADPAQLVIPGMEQM